ncbi:MAG TPA: DUF4918 family protein, partial [Bacteroidales bacterium]|nr:DUF4918 family protein [Bacteroidales bacterium]
TLADKIISFYTEIDFRGILPAGVSIMNPFRNNPDVINTVTLFYRKYYSDYNKRHMIIGINPGRLGAGATGIPFTDTIRLKQVLGLPAPGIETYETSSVFMYGMIDRYGGPEAFYGDHYISSVSPLGFTVTGRNGRQVNYNYYDSRELTGHIMDFILDSLRAQLEFGIFRDTCFCLGSGKNYSFLTELNNTYGFFEKIVPLEHPRYIMQYRLKKKQFYTDMYVEKLKAPLQ